MSDVKYPKESSAEQTVKAWDLPYVESEIERDESETNAFNKRSDWRYEPPEPEEEILPPTAQDIEAIRQAAYEEGFESGKNDGFKAGQLEGIESGQKAGYEAGFEEGKEAGLEQTVEQMQQQAQRWSELTNSLYKPATQIDETVQQELLQLAILLARSVIQVETKTNPDVILHALQKATAALPVSEQLVTVKLHPDDLELIQSHFDDEYISQHKWQLVADEDLKQGGCDVSTSNNAVDYSIERRCKDIIDTFLLEQGL